MSMTSAESRAVEHEIYRSHPHQSLHEDYAGALVMVLSLPVRLRYNRERLKLSLRTAAEQIGIAFNTLTRIEHGEQYTEEIMIKILVWLIGAEKLSTPE